jgi:lysozyme
MHLNRRKFLAGAAGALLGHAILETPASRGQVPGFISGIDVSNWQGSIDWDSVAASGITFAFAKASEGITFTDAWFARNWSEMSRVGLYRGAYHFGRPAFDPVAQANHFVDVVQPVSGDLQLVLDLEVTDGRNPAQVWAWTQAFANQIYQLTGRPGMVYTGYYFWRDRVGNPADNLNLPLWIAAWGVSWPLVPRAWSTWTFWQYSTTGCIPGVGGNVDLDFFNGGQDQLFALTLP